MVFNSKDFRKNNYFVLYDMNDNVVSYYDNVEDLQSSILPNYRCSDIVKKFNSHGNPIKVIVDKKMFQLYTMYDV